MIAIDRKKAAAPARLLADGAAHLAAVIRPRATAVPPTLKSVDFDRAIYASDEVRKVLWALQGGKCCFCEKQVEIQYATVEHFRPKTAAVDAAGSKRLGYWWLAYEFRNLYLACPNCNNAKREEFPLAAGAEALAEPAKPWDVDVPEDALLLDPGVDDPEQHLEWVFLPGIGPVPSGKDERGRASVEVLRLNARDELAQLRANIYRRLVQPLISCYRGALASGDQRMQSEFVDCARMMAERETPFAGMVRSMLRQAGIL